VCEGESEAERDVLLEALGDGAVAPPAAAVWRWRDGVSIAVRAVRGEKLSEDIAVPVEPPAKSEAAAKQEEPEKLTFANGLPVREPKDQVPTVVVHYDVVFGDPGAPPALDDAARAMVGLPPAK